MNAHAPQGGDTAVTRLFNPYEKVGTHLYTTKSSEVTMNTKAGWKLDGVIFKTR
ncbi:hypothetical protein JS533_013280 [Bifidobacterium amazonense]|uniref:DUF5648 domain-containing protein n=1 Tax=Bifidobacterium amazonense TaxID=2809027 RepID=A0ABS9VYU7_9BIFI|nr:hypothetical protein [Bifidobacterium amazonense]MCH9277222.1 hypothetical protein [Bifidobacterium amazonense]